MDTAPQPTISDQSTFASHGRKGAGRSQKGIWIAVAVLGVIAFVVVGGIIFSRFISGGKESSMASPTPKIFIDNEDIQETEFPTPTPDEEIDKETIKIEVLNGTGIAKEASFLQNKLGGLGYEDIDTGNADSKNYNTAQVTFYSSFPESLKKELLEKLSDIYSDVKDIDSNRESDVDVQIITGLRPGISRPTAAPKATPDVQEDEESSPSSSIQFYSS